jgi:hypothetical protein
MKTIFKFFIPLIALCIFSCKKTEKEEFTDTPIIESYLMSGDTVSVKITRQIPFSSNVGYSSDNIDALNINLNYNNTNYALQPKGNGIYTYHGLTVTQGVQCTLTFSFNKKNVSAYTYVPTKPVGFATSTTAIQLPKIDATSGPPTSFTQPSPIQLTWANPDASYYLIVVENIEAVLDPIRDFGNSAAPSNRFRKQPVNGTGEQLRSFDFKYFGTHRVILYHVLPDYASLYSQSSTSSQNLSNPSTSILNGYGIFTGLNSDTLYIDVQRL